SVHPDGGFWLAGAHLALNRHFTYPERDMAVDQYAVVEADGTLRVYRNWFRYFNADTITAELAAGGFVVRGLYGDLTGAPLDPDDLWIGVVAQRGG
ncbi:MAG: SAM-dependent methyltransferase, partial [Anaerolineae bacterium]|nr:SAM-dependent methyltransferase [Anaerolineae bacterium]